MRPVDLLKLYPEAWRRRYGAELEGLLHGQRFSPPLVADLLRGAIDAQLNRTLLNPRPAAAGAALAPELFRRPSAVLPLAMSALALCLVLRHIVFVGTARQADEGAEAHLWQLLMAGQLPVILVFAARWVPRAPRRALLVLALQACAGLAAAAPVYLLHW